MRRPCPTLRSCDTERKPNGPRQRPRDCDRRRPHSGRSTSRQATGEGFSGRWRRCGTSSARPSGSTRLRGDTGKRRNPAAADDSMPVRGPVPWRLRRGVVHDGVSSLTSAVGQNRIVASGFSDPVPIQSRPHPSLDVSLALRHGSAPAANLSTARPPNHHLAGLDHGDAALVVHEGAHVVVVDPAEGLAEHGRMVAPGVSVAETLSPPAARAPGSPGCTRNRRTVSPTPPIQRPKS